MHPSGPEERFPSTGGRMAGVPADRPGNHVSTAVEVQCPQAAPHGHSVADRPWQFSPRDRSSYSAKTVSSPLSVRRACPPEAVAVTSGFVASGRLFLLETRLGLTFQLPRRGRSSRHDYPPGRPAAVRHPRGTGLAGGSLLSGALAASVCFLWLRLVLRGAPAWAPLKASAYPISLPRRMHPLQSIFRSGILVAKFRHRPPSTAKGCPLPAGSLDWASFCSAASGGFFRRLLPSGAFSSSEAVAAVAGAGRLFGLFFLRRFRRLLGRFFSAFFSSGFLLLRLWLFRYLQFRRLLLGFLFLRWRHEVDAEGFFLRLWSRHGQLHEEEGDDGNDAAAPRRKCPSRILPISLSKPAACLRTVPYATLPMWPFKKASSSRKTKKASRTRAQPCPRSTSSTYLAQQSPSTQRNRDYPSDPMISR